MNSVRERSFSPEKVIFEHTPAEQVENKEVNTRSWVYVGNTIACVSKKALAEGWRGSGTGIIRVLFLPIFYFS